MAKSTGKMQADREAWEKQYLSAALDAHGGDAQACAKTLGISRGTMFRLCRRYQIRRTTTMVLSPEERAAVERMRSTPKRLWPGPSEGGVGEPDVKPV
jgi:Bacterial regulatory protein, Fis family